MPSPQSIIAEKRAAMPISREFFFTEEEDPGWRQKHPTGPVHSRIYCQCCGQIVAADLEGFGWINNTSFWTTKLEPHLREHSGM